MPAERTHGTAPLGRAVLHPMRPAYIGVAPQLLAGRSAVRVLLGQPDKVLAAPNVLAQSTEVDVLVADDGSPDGTGQIADELTRTLHPRVSVLHRSSKAGRGGAVMAAFRHALPDLRYDWFCEMDADLSHQPEELPAFFAASASADMVVGSRYILGGRIEGWSSRRRAWSRTSNRIIRAVLGVPMTDFTNGYRLYSRRAVELLSAARLRETGYITLSEWAYVIHRAGLPLQEVPTVFINRRFGKSNMSASEAIGAIRALLRMRGWPPGRRS